MESHLTSDRSPREFYANKLVKKAYIRAPVPQLAKGRLPKVSIVISCYNYAHYLPDSIRSALAQDSVDPEVIVVDDASTDDSAAVAQRFADADRRVTVLRHEQNSGPIIAFNNGYAAAKGEFIVRLDADDMLTPGSLARAVALFDAFPSVGLVYGYPHHFTTDIPPKPNVGPARSWTVWSGVDWLAERCRRGTNAITSSEVVSRTSVLKQIGPLNPKLRYAHDMELWLRTAAVSDIGRVDGPDQALHRDHVASWTANEGHMLDILQRRDVFAILFNGIRRQLPFAEELHETAKRTLAAEALEEACRAYDRGRTKTIDVDSYVAFALDTYKGAKDLEEWRALERRRRVGPMLAPIIPIFLTRVLWRRLKYEFAYYRWVKTGL